MNHALEALHLKRDFIEYWGSQKGVGYGRLLIQPHEGRTRPEVAERSGLAAAYMEDPGAMGSGMASALRMTATYWIDKDMMTLVNAAAPSMPDQPLMWEDAPHEYGFTVFDGNLYLIEGDEKIGVRAVMWRRTTTMTTKGQRNGFEITWFSDRYDMQDVLFKDKSWQDLEKYLLPVQDWGLHRLVVASTMMWFTGEETVAVQDWQHADRFRRWLAAFWSLVKTPIPGKRGITDKFEVQPDRALRRRLERDKLTNQYVTFITLRKTKPREKEEGEEDAHREYSHRWLVDGHWRNQYYASENTHRAIYIVGYVKGPADKPLIIKEKVYSWTR
jgi:hypothetical protein